MRKKFTMLFVSLLACVGVMAQAEQTVITDVNQLTDDMECTVSTSLRGGWAVNTDGTQFGSTNDYGFGTVVNAFNNQHVFKFVTIEGKKYLYSVFAEKYVKKDRTLSETGDPIEFIPQNDSTFVVKFDDSRIINLGGDKQMVINNWGSGAYLGSAEKEYDDGNKVTITDVTEYRLHKFVVTYNFKYNGELKYTQITEVAPNSEYPAYMTFPYLVSAAEEKPAGAVTADFTKDINLNVAALPFTTSTLNDGVLNATWYKVHMTSGNKTWNYDIDNNNVSVSDGNPAKWTSAYMFAFVGDPFDGFQIFNKEAGSDKVLWTTNQINGTGTQIVATLLSEVTGDNWILEQGGAGYYAFRREGVNNAYMNPQGGKLCYWLSGSGKTDTNGGHISFVEVTNEELVALAKVDFDAIFAKASGINAGIGTGVGQYTVPANFATVYAAAEDILEQETPNGAEMEAVTTNLKAAIEEVTVNLPVADTFYKMTNVQAANSVMYVDENNGLKHKSGEFSDGSEVFQFVPTTGGYYLYNVARGTYVSTAKVHGGGQNLSEATSVENAKVVKVASFNDGTAPQLSLIPTGGATLHADMNYGTVVGWDGASGSKSAWIIEEATAPTYTLTVGEAGWASLVLGFNATIPNDVKAYIVSSTTNGYANLSEVTGVLPANTPVLIEAAKGDYEFAHTTTSATVAGNMLQGKPYNTYVADDAYVLAKKNDKVGLYKAALNKDANGAEGTTHFLNNANKAYLVVEGANAPMFSFNRGEGTTSIEDVELTNDNVVIYDLTGRRVEKMEKGIYIVNGKKVVIK